MRDEGFRVQGGGFRVGRVRVRVRVRVGGEDEGKRSTLSLPSLSSSSSSSGALKKKHPYKAANRHRARQYIYIAQSVRQKSKLRSSKTERGPIRTHPERQEHPPIISVRIVSMNKAPSTCIFLY